MFQREWDSELRINKINVKSGGDYSVFEHNLFIDNSILLTFSAYCHC